MNTHRLRPIPLTAAAFAPYGDVIETAGQAPRSINEGTTQRYHDLARIDVAREAGRPLLNIFATLPPTLPLAIAMIERHPLSSQAFVPLDSASFLIVVAAPGDDPKADDLRAFIASDGQGVNYAAGVWHHPLIALGRDTRFVVIDRGGEGENCDIHRFAKDEKILLEM